MFLIEMLNVKKVRSYASVSACRARGQVLRWSAPVSRYPEASGAADGRDAGYDEGFSEGMQEAIDTVNRERR
jgi:hypothetical protein